MVESKATKGVTEEDREDKKRGSSKHKEDGQVRAEQIISSKKFRKIEE